MRYSANYSNKIAICDFDEVILDYYENIEEPLISFVELHLGKKIVISVREEKIESFYKNQDWKAINAIACRYKDLQLSVRFGQLKDTAKVSEMAQEVMQLLTVPYFTGHLIASFEELAYVLNFGVSEVYLVSDICFDLKRARRICDDHKVAIRAFPNVLQIANYLEGDLRGFYISPQDVATYERYIDTLEFWGPPDKQEVLLKIYQRGKWPGSLKDLILGLTTDLREPLIGSVYAQARATCKHRCFYGEKCSICETVKQFNERYLKS